MLIMSWNVAGLATTANRIYESYPAPPSSPTTAATTPVSCNVVTAVGARLPKKPSTAAPPSASLAHYFVRHGADIVCLQEHKIPHAQLASRTEPRQASTVPGYESFWSCCVDPTKRGLNGVVTYCKTGLVQTANARPLQSPDLDDQGRCVMTDHGSFVLFNVYVPARGGQPLTYRMKFLRALRTAMQRQRQQGKHVILVGDLNIAHSKFDIYWKDRTVFVNDVIEEVKTTLDRTQIEPWKLDVHRHWANIEHVMQTKEAVPLQTTNVHKGTKFDKFRVAVTGDHGQRIFLGKHETSPEFCLYMYDFTGDDYFDEELDHRVPCQEVNAVRVSVLSELMEKIAGVTWDDATQRRIADTCASIQRISPSRHWLLSLLQQDDMVDCFRHFYPNAEARFTCWHQFTNRRYVNDGSRIDYTIVDRSILHNVQHGADNDATLRCGSMSNDTLSEAAALSAATANGCYQPVAFEGGGITDVPQHVLDTQFGRPHTGMIYTPPSFSDHIAISLLLADDVLLQSQSGIRACTLNESDGSTRKAQPHKKQRSIASFFVSGAPGHKSNTGSKSSRPIPVETAGAKRTIVTASRPGKVSRNSILHHFGKN